MKEWESAREIKGTHKKKLAVCLHVDFVLTKVLLPAHSLSPSSFGWGGAELLKRQPFQQEAINQTKYPGESEREERQRGEERENMEMKNWEFISQRGRCDEQRTWERRRGHAMKEKCCELMEGMRREESSRENNETLIRLVSCLPSPHPLWLQTDRSANQG